MISHTKRITLAALVAPAFTFSFGADSNGVIELNAKISARPKGHLTGVANHLMQLNEVSGVSDEYIDKQLHDFNNIQIFSSIYIGEPKQEFDMIFDTGSSWVWVGTDVCDNCVNAHKFHFNQSQFFHQLTPSISTLRYGKGQVWGYNAKDQVCLAEDSTIGHGCMEDYLFKAVVH